MTDKKEKVYKTLRIRYRQQLKLFPSWTIQTIIDLKQKIITRFDLIMKQDEFNIVYQDWQYISENKFDKRLKILDNLASNNNSLDTNIMEYLIMNKIQLRVIEKMKSKSKDRSQQVIIIESQQKEGMDLQNQIHQRISERQRQMEQQQLVQSFQQLQISQIIQKPSNKMMRQDQYQQYQQYIKEKSQNAQQKSNNHKIQKQLHTIPCNQNNKHYAQCDKCFQYPIVGIRYKCFICDDFDLCQKCHNKFYQEQKSHPFMKIRYPIVEAIKKIQVSYSEENLNKMNQKNCRELKNKESQEQRSNGKKNGPIEISQDELPQIDVQSKSFVEQLFGGRSKRIYKVHPSLENVYCDNLLLDSCS